MGHDVPTSALKARTEHRKTEYSEGINCQIHQISYVIENFSKLKKPSIETNSKFEMSKDLFAWYEMECSKASCVDKAFEGCFKLEGAGPVLGLCREGEVCNSDAIATSCSFAFCPPFFIGRSGWAMFCLQEEPR